MAQPDEAAGVLDDTALVARLRAGDEAAFEALIRSHGGRLLAVARRIVGSEEDARDVVQDALISALRGLPGFAGDARVTTWLHRIVVNTALMKLRTRRRRPEESIEPLLPTFREDGHHDRGFAPWAGTAGREHGTETRLIVRDAIQRLPESYRVVLLLRDIEGLSTEETARAVGATANAVKIRLHRARQALRALLEPHLRQGTA